MSISSTSIYSTVSNYISYTIAFVSSLSLYNYGTLPNFYGDLSPKLNYLNTSLYAIKLGAESLVENVKEKLQPFWFRKRVQKRVNSQVLEGTTINLYFALEFWFFSSSLSWKLQYAIFIKCGFNFGSVYISCNEKYPTLATIMYSPKFC